MSPPKKSCPVCESRVRNLKRHLLKVHATGDKFARQECAKAVDKAKGPGCLRCGVCQRRFRDLTLHMSRNHPEIPKEAIKSSVNEARKRDSQNEDGEVDEITSSSGAEEFQPPPPQRVNELQPKTGGACAKKSVPQSVDLRESSAECSTDGIDRCEASRPTQQDQVVSASASTAKAVVHQREASISCTPKGSRTPTTVPKGDDPRDTDGEASESGTEGSTSDEPSTDTEATGMSDLIERYQGWLQTFVGGDMEPEHAAELAGKIRRMEKFGLDTVERFTDGVLAANMFQELPGRKHWAPGTTISYICAYKNFLEFLLIAETITVNQKTAASAVVSRIARSVYRKRRLRDSERAVQDEKTLLRGRQLQSYQLSAETVRLEGLLQNGRLDSPKDYCRSRNHLMLRVCLANRQRAGAIANMTVEAVKAAESVPDDDGDNVWTMVIALHKTAESHGPAALGLDDELYLLLLQYIDHIRAKEGPGHIAEDTGPMWLTLRGNKVSSKRVSRCIQRAWRRAGQNDRVTTTILRKTAVSKGFEHDPTIMPLLGDHMSHSPAVQKKYYMLSRKRRNTANMTGAIKRAALSPVATAGLSRPTDVANAERRICLPASRPDSSAGRQKVIRYIAGELKKRSNVNQHGQK